MAFLQFPFRGKNFGSKAHRGFHNQQTWSVPHFHRKTLSKMPVGISATTWGESLERQPFQVIVSKIVGFPKSSILIGCSIPNHPFWGTTIVGNPQVDWRGSFLWHLLTFFWNEVVVPICHWTCRIGGGNITEGLPTHSMIQPNEPNGFLPLFLDHPTG